MRPAAATFALVLATAIPLTTQAHIVEKNKITGHSAFALWEYQEGDVFTFVQLSVVNQTTKNPETGKFDDAFAVLSILRFNVVTGEFLAGTAEMTVDQFTFAIDGSTDPNQNSPRDTATFVANDVIFQTSEFQFFTTDINMTWTATGPDVWTVTKDKFKEEPGFYFKSNFRGGVREATATGSVVVESFGDFTPIPSSSAEIAYSSAGFMTVKTGNDAP